MADPCALLQGMSSAGDSAVPQVSRLPWGQADARALQCRAFGSPGSRLPALVVCVIQAGLPSLAGLQSFHFWSRNLTFLVR